jgi:hypothetical protein
VQNARQYKADSGFYTPLLLPHPPGFRDHTSFTLPRSNPRAWGLDADAAALYNTWPDVAGTDYGTRMPSNYHHVRYGKVDDPWALVDWHQDRIDPEVPWNPLKYVGRDALTGENPPANSHLEPMIPAD